MSDTKSVKFRKVGNGYAVLVGGDDIGNVWRVGKVWTCTRAPGLASRMAIVTSGHRTRASATAALVSVWEDHLAIIAAKPAPAPAPAATEWKDPRGPIRRITAIEAKSSHTAVTLTCGHVVELNQTFSYRVGDECRCFKCRAAAPAPVALIDTLLASDADMQAVQARGISFLVSLPSERIQGCHPGFRVFRGGRLLGIVGAVAFADRPVPYRWRRADGQAEGQAHSKDAAALALSDACEPSKPAGGSGALATILAFALSFVGAFATGACSTVGAVQAKPATVGDVQLQALKAANDAIRAERATNVDADEADSEGDCNRMAAPDSADAFDCSDYGTCDQGNDVCDCQNVTSHADPCAAMCTRRAAPDSAEAPSGVTDATATTPIVAPDHEDRGTEIIHATCPTEWRIGQDARSFWYTCPATGTAVTILKSAKHAGLRGEVKADAFGGWVR